MKLIKVIALFAGMLLFANFASAQSGGIDGVLQVELQQMGPIKDGAKVAGYYMFYKTDRAPKGMADYALQILDPELNVVMTKKFTEGKYTVLKNAVSNGRSVLFKFYDPKKFTVKMKGYNFKGEQVITKSRTITERQEKSMYMQPNPLLDELGVVPIPNYGYMEYAPKKLDKLTYTATFLPDSKDNRTWRKNGNGNKVEFAQSICSVDNIAISLIYSREKLLSTKDMEMHVIGFDATSGDKAFDLNLNKIKHNTLILNGQPDGENIVLYGLDFEPGDKITKKSRGLLKLTLDKSGEILDAKSLDWQKDFKFNTSGEKDYGNFYVHDFFAGANNHTFIIGEQISLNGGMTALGAVLGSRGVTFKIEDLIIIELDENFKVVSKKVVEKTRNSFTIPGIPFASIQMIGLMADIYGYFDYEYIQPKNRPGDFTLGYVDWERKAGEKNGFVFNGLTYSDGEYSSDKIKLSKKGSVVRVMEGKPGYVCLVEYLKKEKRIEYRLEKINF